MHEVIIFLLGFAVIAAMCVAYVFGVDMIKSDGFTESRTVGIRKEGMGVIILNEPTNLEERQKSL